MRRCVPAWAPGVRHPAAGCSPQRHDYLVVAVHRHLAGVALQIGPTGLHQVALGIREVALGLPGWPAIGLPGQASPGHRLDGQSLQIRGLHSGVLGSLNRLVSASGASASRAALASSASSCRCRAVAAALSASIPLRA